MAKCMLKLSVKVQMWRRAIVYAWIAAAVLCERTLPGSVDERAETDRMIAFLMRGVKISVS